MCPWGLGVAEPRWNMANLIAILILGLQYSIVILVIDLTIDRPLPLWLALAVFLLLASIGILVWEKKKSSEKVEEWKKLTKSSLILGLAFFAADELIAYLHGQVNPLRFPGGLLALPLTIAIFPGMTSICVAGVVRAIYITKSNQPQRAAPH